ncbi:MAG: histidine phosphatase family protein [Bacteroidetes bacterium]|nr:histidine phosphatase family protein [Bacteroidota bacterium]
MAITLTAFSAQPTSDKSATKTLYLVRHAKSSDSDPSLQDFDRPLSDRGFGDAPAMGKRLKKLNVTVDVIVASPSKRTTQTIELICREIDYNFDKIQWDSTIYRCTAETLLRAINNLDNTISSAMFVGHNPAITQTANFLQQDTTFEEVPTCGVVAIRFETADWKTIGSKNATLIFFERPKRN